MNWFRDFFSNAREWSQGRHWLPRAIMWGWFCWMLLHHWKSDEYTSFLGGLNLGIHEFGHLIFGPMGQFTGVFGGSLFQCLVPVISIVMFYRQEDYFAFSFSFVWLGTNLIGVARYMSDARALQLELVSPFGGGDGEIIHDWNFIFHKWNCLQHDTTIGAATRWAGIAAMGLGILWGAWILWLMIRSPRKDHFDGLKKLDTDLNQAAISPNSHSRIAI